MQLDVGQIELLDIQLPPSSSPSIATKPEEKPSEEVRVSKGPPPLPPSLPPAPVDLGSIPAPPMQTLEPPPAPAAPAPSVVSARNLVGGPSAPQGSPVLRFLVGIGAATVLSVAGFFVFRSMHKAPPAQPTAAPSSASAPAPTHTFTMAPIEFTATGSSEPEPESSATPPVASGHPGPHAGIGAKPPASGSTKPQGRPDDVIKVEN